jgi:hypothetical protein
VQSGPTLNAGLCPWPRSRSPPTMCSDAWVSTSRRCAGPPRAQSSQRHPAKENRCTTLRPPRLCRPMRTSDSSDR